MGWNTPWRVIYVLRSTTKNTCDLACLNDRGFMWAITPRLAPYLPRAAINHIFHVTICKSWYFYHKISKSTRIIQIEAILKKIQISASLGGGWFSQCQGFYNILHTLKNTYGWCLPSRFPRGIGAIGTISTYDISESPSIMMYLVGHMFVLLLFAILLCRNFSNRKNIQEDKRLSTTRVGWQRWGWGAEILRELSQPFWTC